MGHKRINLVKSSRCGIRRRDSGRLLDTDRPESQNLISQWPKARIGSFYVRENNTREPDMLPNCAFNHIPLQKGKMSLLLSPSVTQPLSFLRNISLECRKRRRQMSARKARRFRRRSTRSRSGIEVSCLAQNVDGLFSMFIMSTLLNRHRSSD